MCYYSHQLVGVKWSGKRKVESGKWKTENGKLKTLALRLTLSLKIVKVSVIVSVEYS